LIAGGLSFSFAESVGLSGDLFSALGGLTGAGLSWAWLMKRPGLMKMPEMIDIERLDV